MLTNRVSFNLRSSISRFLELQTQMSSGRRINKPSDDPLGVLRDLDYRTELSKNYQYRKNISQAQNWMSTYDSILSEANNMVVSATLVAEAMANGTVDADLRSSVAFEIKSTIEQIMQLANTQHEGKYIFSGFETDHKALVGTINGVTFNGDNGQLKFKIESSTLMQINLSATDVFLQQLKTLGEDADLNIALTTATSVADIKNGLGISQVPGTISIVDQNLGITSNIDLSGALTINDIITTVNNQLIADGITNLTIGVGSENNNLSFSTTKNDLISAATALVNLNDGNGIDLLSIGKIIVSDGAGINVEIDLKNASSIGDVINEFNAKLAASGVNNVTMTLNAAQNGLQINDTNGVPLGLTISEADTTSFLATDLGILGSISPNLIGGDLDPQVSFKINEVGDTTAEDLGILAEFTNDYSGFDLDPALTVNSNISDLRNGTGYGMGLIQISQGNLTRTIDTGAANIATVQDLIDAFNNSGLDITASINSKGTGVQIVNNDTNKSFTIEDLGSGQVTRNFGIFGSSDLMGALNVLVNALEKNDYLGIGEIMGTLQDATSHLLLQRAIVGAKAIRLESTNVRLLDQEMTFTKHLSEIEDADLSKLVTDLSTYENNYRAALIASAKIIQPSLLDFLR